MYLYYCLTLAPPIPTNVTALLMNASSVRVAWQWTSSSPAPDCFNTTTVTYRPEGGGESSLQLSDPAATEATLTGLQCNTSYTITVVATAGEHRREGVVLLPPQGIHRDESNGVYLVRLLFFCLLLVSSTPFRLLLLLYVSIYMLVTVSIFMLLGSVVQKERSKLN